MRKPAATPWACLASMSEGCSIKWCVLNSYIGEGAVVEAGAFCGASTCCLAAGLRDNPLAAGRSVRISLTTLLRASPTWSIFCGRSSVRRSNWESPSRRSIAALFPRRLPIVCGFTRGTCSIRYVARRPDPIEILFVDVAKTLALSGKVLTEFFTHLIPEKSVVIQQDFYHPTAFYLPVVMEFLWTTSTTAGEAGRDWSVVFKLEYAIPREKLEIARPLRVLFCTTTRCYPTHDATRGHAGA